MSIVLYTLGFILLLCSIFAFLTAIVRTYPLRPEPELLVVDDPLPGDESLADEPVAEAQWAR